MSGEPAFFELGVEDAERARAFYGALFDWTFTSGPHGGHLIETRTIPGGLHGGDPRAAPYLFFRVDDLDSAVARVRELGGAVEGLGSDESELDSAHGRFTLCRDDQGSPFGLFQPPPSSQ
jgi:uncharacterized protein